MLSSAGETVQPEIQEFDFVEQYEGLRLERADGVLKLTFDRPELGNVIHPDMVPSLARIFEKVNGDPSVRSLLICSEGANFSLGGDVRRFATDLTLPTTDIMANYAARMDSAARMVSAYNSIEVPIVVAARGGIAGAGLMFPLGADYVIGSSTTFLMFAHQRLGLSPDGGVSYFLPRVVGERIARQLLLTAARADANEALRIGIISRLVEPADVEAQAMIQAEAFARAPVLAARSAKRLVKQSMQASLQQQLACERDAIVECVGHADFREGVDAFLEKRPANYPSTRINID